jgi:hypothetical protein
MDKLSKGLCGVILAVAGTLGMLNVMSAEPMIMLTPPKEYIANFTAKEYAQKFETTLGKTFGYLVSPGAKLGRYLHNTLDYEK